MMAYRCSRQRAFFSESLMPQQVSVMPFPTAPYRQNSFYTITASIFPFLFSFSFLYPASRLIRDVVAEKELRVREYTRAMGVPAGALMASWWCTYTAVGALQSAIITGITASNIFAASDKSIVFGMFCLFSLSTTCLCMLVRCCDLHRNGQQLLAPLLQITTLFSKARTANIVGMVFLFGSVFPYVGVSSSTVAVDAKVRVVFALALTAHCSFCRPQFRFCPPPPLRCV